MEERIRSLWNGCFAAAVGSCVFIASNSLGSTTYYVDASVSSSGTGTSWSSPKKTIQEAVALTSAGDFIHVAQGTYKPTNQSTPISLANQVSIQGGYKGHVDIPNGDVRDTALYVTTLSGDLGGGTHAYHVVNSPSGTGPQTSGSYAQRANLDGCVVTGGNALGDSSNISNPDPGAVSPCDLIAANVGAGVLIIAGNPRIDHCSFQSNLADHNGGGILCSTQRQLRQH